MTDKERYKQAFSTLHASDTISLENIKVREKVFNPASKLLVVCICAAITVGMSVTSFAYKDKIISRILGWGNNFEIISETDEKGDVVSFPILHTDNLKNPVIIQDKRLIFVVNNESIDISELVSETNAYRYEYPDEEGNTHIWLIGLNSEDIENYGYAEYIRDSEGLWLGGYSARVNIGADGKTEAQWLEKAKSELNIPW